ncbi:cysteine hydrolase [Salipaludibacillus sp. LMS25]|jgi:nicotinamidase-related amidase|uniref:isochorismatase family cysteine hydrolase n=1 Tax=Salipaludibacillus sp. LMS25 TaxID=2924031 RepID=UPI0020D10C33|nr:isochorismatase family cysteine hydrolase [Salipaludibacillus sp. LMS25]UTR15797.1 cysteine hydrolase [Salipaludibacillus sp. LMS25]
MGEKNDNPHVHDYEHVALVFVDMISDFSFKDGDKLFPHTFMAAQKMAQLKAGAKKLNIPTLYVNDNYGRWQSDFPGIVEEMKQSEQGKKIINLLQPDNDDYFILKPQYSAFFMTPLELLLDYLNVKSLIICGVAGNRCIHFTANDAYMRGYKLYIPSDCTASNSQEENDEALHLMAHVLKATIQPSEELDLEAIKFEWRHQER